MKKIYMNKRPIVFFAVFLTMGILLSLLLYRIEFLFYPVLGLAVLLCIFVGLKRKLFFLLLIMGFIAGYLGFFVEYKVNVRSFDASATYKITAKVYDSSERYDGEYLVYLKDISANGEKIPGKGTVLAASATSAERYTILEFDASVSVAEPMLFNNSLNGYSAKRYYTFSASNVEVKGKSNNFIDRLRIRATGGMDLFLSDRDKGIAESLVFGDKMALDARDSSSIRSSGLSHIFAVSGLHISFFIGVLTFLLSKLRIKSFAKILLLSTVLAVYLFLCAFPYGAIRAAIMAVVYLFAFELKRKPDRLTALAFSLSCILVFNPSGLFSLSLIMSMLAVLGIICFYRPLYTKMQSKHKPLNILSSSAALSVSANVFLLPVSAGAFGSFALYFIPANMIAVPLASFAFILIMAIGILCLIYPGFGIFYRICGFPISALRAVSEFFSSLPMASANIGRLFPLTLGFAVAMLVLSGFFIAEKRTKAWIIIGISLLTAIVQTVYFVAF